MSIADEGSGNELLVQQPNSRILVEGKCGQYWNRDRYLCLINSTWSASVISYETP